MIHKTKSQAGRHQKPLLALLATIALSCSFPGLSVAEVRGEPAKMVAVPGKSRISAHSILILDRETGEILLEKNSQDLQPIASITKLMVAIAVLDSGVDLNETIVLERDDERPSRGRRKSRLSAGSSITRNELLKLMLMSSENKAAYVLARSHPEGLDDFIRTMNDKAVQIGMRSTQFVEPTGLSDGNVSTAWDLVALLRESERYPLIREYSTEQRHQISAGRRTLNYVNSNRLIRDRDWEIELQKTGTTTKAGKCLVMLTNLGGRPVEMVLLKARGKLARVRDARIIKRLIEAEQMASTAAANEAGFR
jgi:D-alanyl-D-alanine endopeptidase (penicillin-binding protein 7)